MKPEKTFTANDALEYVFGKMDLLNWERIVTEKMTPPLPLPEHLKNMGLIHKSQAVQAEARVAELEEALAEIVRLCDRVITTEGQRDANAKRIDKEVLYGFAQKARADKAEAERDAMVGAAYEAAANVDWSKGREGEDIGPDYLTDWQRGLVTGLHEMREAIRALTPASARAAYTAAIRAAVVEGMKRSANIAARYNSGRGAGAATARAIVTAIMSAAEKEPPNV